MIDQNIVYQNIIKLLDENQVEYKAFSHKEAFTYEELAEVQRETGFIGTEMKCLVLKANETFFIYVTLQGEKVNFENIKNEVGANKVRLALPEELNQFFGAKPGCAYPFGFAVHYDIYLDPKIYNQEWLLFSPVFANQTIQVRGGQLKRIFDGLENKVKEVIDFNIGN